MKTHISFIKTQIEKNFEMNMFSHNMIVHKAYLDSNYICNHKIDQGMYGEDMDIDWY
jgi:hypothetical protein